VKYNWIPEAERMIELGAKINEVDHSGQTPLCYAVRGQKHEMARLLLQHGADADIAFRDSETLLHRAVSKKDTEMVQILIPFTKKKEVQYNGRTPLELAEIEKLQDIADLIRISNGTKEAPKAQIMQKETTPFQKPDSPPKNINFLLVAERDKVIQAARENNYSLVKELIERADSEESLNRIREGHSLVHHALLQDNPNKEFIHYLLAKGINYTHVNYKCKTPAEIALEGKIYAFFECLEENNLDCVDSEGNTPLHFAVKSQNTEMLQYLLKSGYDIYAENNRCETPLTQAVVQRYDEADDTLIEMLLKHGYDINHKNKWGRTILFSCKNPEMMERFISKGADIHITDNSGKSLLFEFIFQLVNRCYGLIEYLVEKGVDVNLPDQSGVTPFDYLISRKEGVPITIAPILYTYGEQPSKNEYYDILEEMEQFLKQRGAKSNKRTTAS
jgi:ankyrin repeat protein